MNSKPFEHGLLAAGPILILLLWFLLPTAVDEGFIELDRTDEDQSGVIAELVGYTFRPEGAVRAFTVGRDHGMDLRLHQAPVPRRAAVFLPSGVDGRIWRVAPLAPGETLALLNLAGEKLRKTSLYPWAGNHGRIDIGCTGSETRLTPAALRQVQVWGPDDAPGREPEIISIHEGEYGRFSTRDAAIDLLTCDGQKGVWWAETGTDTDTETSSDTLCPRPPELWEKAELCWGWQRRACSVFGTSPAAEVQDGVQDGDLVSIYDQPLLARDHLWLRAGSQYQSFLLGVDASGCLQGKDRLHPACAVETQRVCDAAGRELGVFGPVEVGDGDVLGMGRTRFLVSTTGGGALRLLHVRHPNPDKSRSYFRGTSSAELYHPNRRALWRVPMCQGVHDTLSLRIQPAEEREAQGKTLRRGHLVEQDRVRRQQIEQAMANVGVPLDLPRTLRGSPFERETVSLCVEARDRGDLEVRVTPGGQHGLRIARGALDELDTDTSRWTSTAPARLPLGRTGSAASGPREVVLELGGNLIRVAPAAGRRITHGFRFRLASFALAVVTLLALLLHRARRLRTLFTATRQMLLDGDPITLLQVTQLTIVALLFLGADYHLRLALLPQLAGKPDYLQAFLQGMVGCTLVLGAATGFTLGPSLLRRLGHALLGSAAVALLAMLWWFWEAGMAADGLWLSQVRNAVLPLYTDRPFGHLLGWITIGSAVGGLVLLWLDRFRLGSRLGEWLEALGYAALRRAKSFFFVLVVIGAVASLGRAALAVEVVILVAVAWSIAHAWGAVSRPGARVPTVQRKIQWLSNCAGGSTLFLLLLFFTWGTRLHDLFSFVLVVAALVLLLVPPLVKFLELRDWAAWRQAMEKWREEGRLEVRIVLLWGCAVAVGILFAGLVLNDMGSIAAWLPAILSGLFLWIVQPDDAGDRKEELFRARAQLLLVWSGGLLLLGTLDVLAYVFNQLPFSDFERQRQRFDLAQDISYILPGEWIAQVRWLASRQSEDLLWVPNMNSDVAIFGLAAHHGWLLTLGASAALVLIALFTANAADRALRTATALTSSTGTSTTGISTTWAPHQKRLYAVLYRWLGLSLFMFGVLLISQWLIHLSTGVVLHLPITGLVFPWISHGNTTHLLYTVLFTVPLAFLAALGEVAPAPGRPNP